MKKFKWEIQYDEWIEFRKAQNLPPMTRTQNEFAKTVFKGLNQIGNMRVIFDSIDHFLRINDYPLIENYNPSLIGDQIARPFPPFDKDVQEWMTKKGQDALQRLEESTWKYKFKDLKEEE